MEGVRAPAAPGRASSCGLPLLLLPLLLLTCCRAEEGKTGIMSLICCRTHQYCSGCTSDRLID